MNAIDKTYIFVYFLQLVVIDVLGERPVERAFEVAILWKDGQALELDLFPGLVNNFLQKYKYLGVFHITSVVPSL